MEKDTRTSEARVGSDPGESGLLVGRSVSRREFLKVAGIAGATVGLGAGLGGLLAACGGGTTTTTTAATTSTSAGGATTTAGVTTTAGATTTVVTSAEVGDAVKLGYVVPITGASGAFGAAAQWHAAWFKQNVWKDALLCGDGKKHPIDPFCGQYHLGNLTGGLFSAKDLTSDSEEGKEAFPVNLWEPIPPHLPWIRAILAGEPFLAWELQPGASAWEPLAEPRSACRCVIL